MAFYSRYSLARKKKKTPPTVDWRAPALFCACVFCVSEGRRLAQIWFDCGEGSGLCVPEGTSDGTSANFLRLPTRLRRFSDGGPVHPTHHHPHHPEKPTRLPPSGHQQLQELKEWQQMFPSWEHLMRLQSRSSFVFYFSDSWKSVRCHITATLSLTCFIPVASGVAPPPTK